MERAPSHDWMVGRADRGCLVVADISGYTKYLQGSELEHAQDVLGDLTETVVRHLRPVLTLNKLEGDAAFAYAPEDRIEASMLLDDIDECYFAFQSRRRDITQATTCDCNACILIPGLNLKFVVHHGSFVRRPIAGREELTGIDVILVHRLLKNAVTEMLGLRGYALFTEACIAALGIEPSALEMKEHRESYEDVGEVKGFVEDLEARWRHEEERRRVYVVQEGAAFEFEDEYPVPPQVRYGSTPPLRRSARDGKTTGLIKPTVAGAGGLAPPTIVYTVELHSSKRSSTGGRSATLRTGLSSRRSDPGYGPPSSSPPTAGLACACGAKRCAADNG